VPAAPAAAANPGAAAPDTAADPQTQATRKLVDALVEQGVMSREKADAVLRSVAQGTPAPAAPLPATTADGKPILRVPYIPESVRKQLRDELKEEVTAQARTERWGVPNALPAWADKIKIEGDVRFRLQRDKPGRENTPAATYLESEASNDNGLSRAPDFGAYAITSTGSFYPTGTTTEGRDRERLRLRLGISAKVTDEVGVGMRLSTGSATDRVSTNQTLGQNFNKYQVFWDRAFLRLDPAEWMTLQAGRMPNPWFSSEMTWSENLNFEGLAATFRISEPQDDFQPFFTMGYFPLREDTPPGRDGRALMGAQLGTQWSLSARARFKLGVALYSYRNIEGRSDEDYRLVTTTNGVSVVTGAQYGRYEYGNALRQKGNTLFETNPMGAGVDTAPVWGLAYRFRPLVLTASAEFTHFSPFNLLLSAEFAKNTAFSESDFHKRATDAVLANASPGGRDKGYQFRMAVGASEVRDADDWQLNLTYRHLGSDAVLDAFTDSDLGLGGTNVRGYILGAQYGLYRNTALGLRYMAAENIDSTLNASYPKASYKVNTLQVDLNVRF
jgi:hypothetical protein